MLLQASFAGDAEGDSEEAAGGRGVVQTAAAPAGRGGEEAPHDPDRGTETARPAKEVSTIPQTALWVYNVTNSSVCASCHKKLYLICVSCQKQL